MKTTARVATARRIAAGVAATDVAAVRWIIPARVAAVTTLLVGVLIVAGHPAAALAMGLGALMTGLGDTGGAVSGRIRGMAWTAVFISGACALGTLSGEWWVLRIAMTGVIAFACGYAGRAGPRGGMVGLLSLVTFTIYAGAPASVALAATDGLLMLAAGGVQILVGVTPQLMGRTGGVRGDICVAFRSVGHQLRVGHVYTGSASAVLKIQAARRGVQALEADRAATAPLHSLLDACDEARIAGLVLLEAPCAVPADEQALLDDFRLRAADAARAIGHAVELRWRTRRVGPGLVRMEAAAESCARVSDERARAAVEDLRLALRTCADIVLAGAAVSPANSVPVLTSSSAESPAALIGRASFDDLIMRHAVRLAGAELVATGLAIAVGWPHSYWVPMTVAWVMRPDMADTTARVASRLVGTAAGLLVVALVVGLFGFATGTTLALVFVGSFGLCMFRGPNYAIGTASVSMFVIALFGLLGDPLITTLDARLLGTLAAAVIAVTFCLALPTRTARDMAGALAGAVRALSAYAELVRAGDRGPELYEARAALSARRVAAGRLVDASGREIGRQRMAFDTAHALLRDLLTAVAIVAAGDVARRPPAPGTISDAALAQADDLARRLDALQESGEIPLRSVTAPPTGSDDLAEVMDSAQATLDAAMGVASTAGMPTGGRPD